MRTKLSITFLVLVILLSLLFIGFTYQTLVEAVTFIAGQNLRRAAGHTTAQIDGFILTNLDLVQIASQLESTRLYLRLAPEKRSGSPEEKVALSDLRNLSLQNSQYRILSFAILDTNGRDWLDTDSIQINRDENKTLYFQNALTKEGAFVSPILFEENQRLGDLFFIAPVYSESPEKRSGFVRTRASGVSLQVLASTSSQYEEDQAGAILLDENGLQLANDFESNAVYRTISPISAERIETLKTQGRLPYIPVNGLSTNSVDLANHLNQSNGSSSFATTLIAGNSRKFQAVVKGMDTMPWRLVFAQPQDVFLKPISDYTRRLLWLTVFIAGGAIVLSAGVARWLSEPIVRLTEATNRVSQGDFTARIKVESKDEIGDLAMTFNVMTERLHDMLYELETRVKKSEVLYKDVVDGQSELICRFQPDFIITFANEAFSRFFGIPTTELVGESIFLFILEGEHITMRNLISKFQPDCPVVSYEQRALNALGEESWLLWSATGIYTRELVLSEVQIVGRDITEQRKAELTLLERETRLRMITDHMIDVVTERDLGGVFHYVSPSCHNLFGYLPEELINHPFHEFIHPDDLDQVMKVTQDATKSSSMVKVQYRFQCKDGHYVWVESAGNILLDENGHPIGGVYNIRDITDRKQTEQALWDVNQHLTEWVDELEQHNKESTILNEMNEMLQGTKSPEEAYRVLQKYVESLFPQQSGMIYIRSEKQDLLEAVVSWGNGLQGEPIITLQDCWALRRGHIHRLTLPEERLTCSHYQVMQDPGEFRPSLCIPLMTQSEIIGLLHLLLKSDKSMERYEQLGIMVADRTALALANLKLQMNLRQQAIRDPLTGLYNCQYMEETLEREIRRAVRHERGLGIMVVDIDHFKRFNDTFSYSAGDMLLQEMGKLLQSHLRGGDVVCRYGGEEFVIILPESSIDHTIQRAEQLCSLVRETRIVFRAISLGQVTISIGIASYPENGTLGEELLREADIALHRAKSAGRDQVMVYKPTTAGGI